MQKQISYTDLTEFVMKQVENGERFVVTSDGKAVAALVPLEDLDVIADFESVQDEIDHDAVEDAKNDANLMNWDDYKRE